MYHIQKQSILAPVSIRCMHRIKKENVLMSLPSWLQNCSVNFRTGTGQTLVGKTSFSIYIQIKRPFGSDTNQCTTDDGQPNMKMSGRQPNRPTVIDQGIVDVTRRMKYAFHLHVSSYYNSISACLSTCLSTQTITLFTIRIIH